MKKLWTSRTGTISSSWRAKADGTFYFVGEGGVCEVPQEFQAVFNSTDFTSINDSYFYKAKNNLEYHVHFLNQDQIVE